MVDHRDKIEKGLILTEAKSRGTICWKTWGSITPWLQKDVYSYKIILGLEMSKNRAYLIYYA